MSAFQNDQLSAFLKSLGQFMHFPFFGHGNFTIWLKTVMGVIFL